MPTSDNARRLALQIARCAGIADARGDCSHRCHQITAIQQYATGGQTWQVPEPWRGDIENAPLLFVSSNPSIDPLDDCPWNLDSDTTIVDYYAGSAIAREFPYARYQVGNRMRRPVRFWTAIHAHARDLFEPLEVTSGIDYALTEVVHCKSRDEYGVNNAAPVCIERYLAQILRLSKARVIVCLGDFATKAVQQHFADENSEASTRTDVQVLSLPHPNARKVRSVSHCLTADELREARSALHSRRRVSQTAA